MTSSMQMWVLCQRHSQGYSVCFTSEVLSNIKSYKTHKNSFRSACRIPLPSVILEYRTVCSSFTLRNGTQTVTLNSFLLSWSWPSEDRRCCTGEETIYVQVHFSERACRSTVGLQGLQDWFKDQHPGHSSPQPLLWLLQLSISEPYECTASWKRWPTPWKMKGGSQKF